MQPPGYPNAQPLASKKAHPGYAFMLILFYNVTIIMEDQLKA